MSRESDDDRPAQHAPNEIAAHVLPSAEPFWVTGSHPLGPMPGVMPRRVIAGAECWLDETERWILKAKKLEPAGERIDRWRAQEVDQ